MRFVIFTHSLVSDWNHGNAHFLRGIATELLELGPRSSDLRARATAGAGRICWRSTEKRRSPNSRRSIRSCEARSMTQARSIWRRCWSVRMW